jgi:hypothetical protein
MAERQDFRYTERWWHHNPEEERYWLEATDRDEIGRTIEGEFFDQSGNRRNPAYLLAKREVNIGDVVIHLDLSQRAFVACSTVAQAIVEDSDDYWTIRLSDTRPVRPHLPFSEWERREAEIAVIVKALPVTQRKRNPRHLPFEWRTTEGFVLHQGAYLTKLPAAIVGLYPSLAKAAEGRRRPPARGR